MTKKLLYLLLAVVSGFPALAVTSKNVSYKSGDETVQAVLYTPEGKGPFPGMLSSTNGGD